MELVCNKKNAITQNPLGNKKERIMFPSSNYVTWDYDPQQSDVQSSIVQMVHDAVNVQAQTLAASVAQEAKLLLGDQVLLTTDVSAGTNVSLGRTPTGTGTNNQGIF